VIDDPTTKQRNKWIKLEAKGKKEAEIQKAKISQLDRGALGLYKENYHKHCLSNSPPHRPRRPLFLGPRPAEWRRVTAIVVKPCETPN
jgi:hypothetical protein